MHYYQLNIADYRKDTQHLVPMEHYIYRTLMDWYYLDEKPIPKITQVVSRRLGLVTENEVLLNNVLTDFFEDTENGWVHHRIEREIAAYHGKAKTARVNGSKGGRPKKTQSVNLANPKEPDRNLTINHKPLTNNHIVKEKDKKKNGGKPPTRFQKPTLDELIFEFDGRVFNPEEDAKTFLNHYESNGWKVGKNPMKSWTHAVTNWITRSNQNGKSRSNTQKLTKSQLRDQQARDAMSGSENNGGTLENPAILGIGPRRT